MKTGVLVLKDIDPINGEVWFFKFVTNSREQLYSATCGTVCNAIVALRAVNNISSKFELLNTEVEPGTNITVRLLLDATALHLGITFELKEMVNLYTPIQASYEDYISTGGIAAAMFYTIKDVNLRNLPEFNILLRDIIQHILLYKPLCAYQRDLPVSIIDMEFEKYEANKKLQGNDIIGKIDAFYKNNILENQELHFHHYTKPISFYLDKYGITIIDYIYI